ncbi:HAD-IIA family hydrolase [Ktedonosporobacter rubrisoli]|uniref:HAD-IIA family hydrolase n=1 Tax=Ktedonosporobacter rubrisoli TaxID=2509675 RepID=A0A4P6JI15_KTERU|nr:HAD-IIA family hydrolase [Ktedonosporobacter rubrisoli]QBD74593.1 HAD-IIA family hydrolase [Ktedonosporobacter rubrisoli]
MLADQFDAFFLDLDGVVYIGGQALPGTVSTLQRLRALGKRIRFLTNNNCSRREQIIKRLRRMGIEAHKEELFTASWATCLYLRQQGIRRVYLVGSSDNLLELREAGIAVDEEKPEAVVVGCEDELTYAEVDRAARFVRQGARFIASMADAVYPSPAGLAAAAGAFVAAIETASGRKAVVIGKPSAAMFLEARQGLEQIDPARIVMIGDTPASDILGAHQAGLHAILIASVAPDTRLYPGTRDMRQPDAIIPDLSALFAETYTIRAWKPVPYSWPQRVVPGITAIVLDAAGNVLVCQRSSDGLWSLPTGPVEPGETIEEALRRTVAGETDLPVHIRRLSGVYSEPVSQIISASTGEVVHIITTGFLCEAIEEPAANKAGEENLVRWIDPQRLPEPFRPAHHQWLADALQQTERAFIR